METAEKVEPRTETGINRWTERYKLLNSLEREKKRQPNLLYYATNHFVVVYRNVPGIYKHFDGWLDTDPSSLAQVLETSLTRAFSHFNLPEPSDTFQAVTVRKVGFSNILKVGYHSGRVKDSPSLWMIDEPEGEKESVQYSHVFPRGKGKGETRPDIYDNAIHEAIGHGFVNTALMGSLLVNQARRISFLEEGLACYIKDVTTERDSHQVLAQSLVLNATWVFFPELMRDKQITVEEAERKMGKKSIILNNIPLKDFFKLRSSKYDVSKENSSIGILNMDSYTRGPSFMKYLVDTFGVERFKTWVHTVTSEKFYDSLSTTFGVSVEEIEKGWKDAVLEGEFTENPFLKGMLKSDNQLRWIQDAYLGRVEVLKKDIKGAFSIDFLPVGENRVNGVTYYSVPWEEADLRIIKETLGQLPPSLYLPRTIDGKEEKLRLDLNDLGVAVRSFCPLSGNPVVATLSRGELHPLEDTLPPLATIAHGLIHSITTTDLSTYIDRILKPIAISGDFGTNDCAKLQKAFEFSSKHVLPYRQSGLSLEQHRLNYGASSFEEFFSVAGEFYVRGQDYFVKIYEPFLGKERAEKLYEGMKQEIFRGREY